MDRLYGLELGADNIRLLTLFPNHKGDSVVECGLAKYSLKDFTDDYKKFLSSTNMANLSKRKIAAEWVQSRIPP